MEGLASFVYIWLGLLSAVAQIMSQQRRPHQRFFPLALSSLSCFYVSRVNLGPLLHATRAMLLAGALTPDPKLTAGENALKTRKQD